MRRNNGRIFREFLLACTSTTLLIWGLTVAGGSCQKEQLVAYSAVNPDGAIQREQSDPIPTEKKNSGADSSYFDSSDKQREQEISRSVIVEPMKPVVMQPVQVAPLAPAAPVAIPAAPAKVLTQTKLKHKPAVTAYSKAYRLQNLKHRTAYHDTPDAIVYIPKGFDRSRPPRLFLFLHGLTNTLDDVQSIWKVNKYMEDAPANSVLIMPEWALDPIAYSKNAGCFHNKGFFRGMLKEIVAKTPELRGIKIGGLKNITVMSYSGGFRAARSIMENNGMDEQVSDLVLFDSLYLTDWFDPWLKKNVWNLASGKKRYYNFFFDTADNSVAQYQRLKRMFRAAGQNAAVLAKDTGHPHSLIHSHSISNKKVLFKYTRLENAQFIAHQNVVDVYFPRVIQAIRMRELASIASIRF